MVLSAAAQTLALALGAKLGPEHQHEKVLICANDSKQALALTGY